MRYLRHIRVPAVFAIMLVCAMALPAAAQDDRAQQETMTLRQALAAAPSYELGDSRLPFSTIDDAIAAALKQSANRDARQIEDALLEIVRSDSATIDARKETCRRLVLIGSDRSVETLATLLRDAELSHMASYALEAIRTEAAQRAIAQWHVERLIDRSASGSDRAYDAALTLSELGVDDAIAAALSGASATQQAVMIRVLGERGAVDHEDLLESFTAENQPEDVRVAAYLALANLHDWDAQVNRTPLFRQAMTAATTPQNKKRVLAAIQADRDSASLPIVERQLSDDAVAEDAADVVITLAQQGAESDRDQAKAAIHAVLQRFDRSTDIGSRAREALDRIETREGFVTQWLISGPYREGRSGDESIFDFAFLPERDPQRAEWTEVPEEGLRDPGIVNFLQIYGGEERAAYSRTLIIAPQPMNAQLQLGSDDGVKVWLNDAVVHENDTVRGLTLNSDVISIRLERGENPLLIKITQTGGDWQFAARIRDTDGGIIEGLEYRVPERE